MPATSNGDRMLLVIVQGTYSCMWGLDLCKGTIPGHTMHVCGGAIRPKIQAGIYHTVEQWRDNFCTFLVSYSITMRYCEHLERGKRSHQHETFGIGGLNSRNSLESGSGVGCAAPQAEALKGLQCIVECNNDN